MHPLAEKYLRHEALPTIFCPGCGHGTVLNAFIRAAHELDIMEQLGLVGGIGCSSWTPVFINTDVLHTLHGRAIAVATGLKLAKPDRKVVVFTGDGDCVGIGGNHFIHGARRNIDITVFMLDNFIYGMTGGQVAPTTPTSARTQTSPFGNPEPPMDACSVAISAGASFVGRSSTANPAQLIQLMKKALNHEGFSFVHILSQCPTQAGRYIYGSPEPSALFNHLKKITLSKSKAEKLTPEKRKGLFVTGVLHQNGDQKELTKSLQHIAAQ